MSKVYILELIIAGKKSAVVYDGVTVCSPDFPGEPLKYTSSCGIRVGQEALVSICRSRLSANPA